VIWALVWLVLVLGAAAVLGLLARDVWRRSRLLVRELGAATDRLTEITDRLGDLSASQAAFPDDAPDAPDAPDARAVPVVRGTGAVRSGEQSSARR